MTHAQYQPPSPDNDSTVPVTKSVKVTFVRAGLPNGRHATFKIKNDGKEEMWIAWPLSKHQANLTVVDRLLGGLQTIRRTCLEFINADPHDAGRVARLLEILQRAEAFYRENADEKVRVQVS